MKKYSTPKTTATVLLSQDIITSSFGIASSHGGDTISWDDLVARAGIDSGFEDSGLN